MLDGFEDHRVQPPVDAAAHFILGQRLGVLVVEARAAAQLRGRLVEWLAGQPVDAGRRGVNELPDAVANGGVDHVAGAVHIGARLPVAVPVPGADIGGHVEQRVESVGHGSLQRVGLPGGPRSGGQRNGEDISVPTLAGGAQSRPSPRR